MESRVSPALDGDEARIGDGSGIEHIICIEFGVKNGGFLDAIQFGQQVIKAQGTVCVRIVEGAVLIVFKGHHHYQPHIFVVAPAGGPLQGAGALQFGFGGQGHAPETLAVDVQQTA